MLRPEEDPRRSAPPTTAPVPFADFLSRSLEILAREMPRSYASLSETLRGYPVAFTVDGAAVLVCFDGSSHRMSPAGATAHAIESVLSRRTILDLIDGRASLEASIQRDDFFLRAPLRDLQVFFDALLLYLRGAVRCPSMPALLEQYRAQGAAHDGS